MKNACAAGQSFNPNTLKCDLASNVDCNIDTCQATWDATKKQHVVAYAPDYKDCSSYHLCVEGQSKFVWSCGEGSVFDLTKASLVNGIKFPGECAKKATDSTAQCFDGQNWTVPPFPAPAPTP